MKYSDKELKVLIIRTKQTIETSEYLGDIKRADKYKLALLMLIAKRDK